MSNKAFTKTKEIILDLNYKIVPDSGSGLVLEFNTTKKNKKDEIVPHIERYYFPRIAQALRYYASKIINRDVSSIEECIAKNEAVFNLIDKLDKEFKQY